MNFILKEFLLSGELAEAEHCLRDLEVPHFHHELVYESVIERLFFFLECLCVDGWAIICYLSLIVLEKVVNGERLGGEPEAIGVPMYLLPLSSWVAEVPGSKSRYHGVGVDWKHGSKDGKAAEDAVGEWARHTGPDEQ
eukprot:g35200.t1